MHAHHRALHVAGPDLRLFGTRVPIFRLTALSGAAVAVSLAVTLADAVGASTGVEAMVCGSAIVTFVALALATKAIAGREILVYYHHEVAVLIVTAVVATIFTGRPGRYLDVTALGLGACLAIGRVGCLFAGCCHGRPANRGIRYGRAHAREGFPPWLVGLSLLPVQLIESIAVTGTVAIGVLVILDPDSPGAAFAWYVEAYAVLRFGLEWVRGDEERRYAAGLSEAQWLSLAVSVCVAAAGVAGLLPGGAVLIISPAILLLTGGAALVLRTSRRDLLDAGHLRETWRIAREAAQALPGPVAPAETSRGVVLSAGQTDGVEHWSLSHRSDSLMPRELRVFADQVAAIRDHAAEDTNVLHGSAGVIHVLLADSLPMPAQR